MITGLLVISFTSFKKIRLQTLDFRIINSA